MQPISPDGPIRLAVTIDDLFLWKGTPVPPERSPLRTAKELTLAFERHGIEGVYSFSNTAPPEDDPALYQVFDHWSEQGHYVANHTHRHPSLNWIEPATYIDDIEYTEKLIDRWSSLAPTRYFRYCMDMWGDTPEKQEAVEAYLQRSGYTSSPVSAWFYDHAWIVPYWRAFKKRDRDAQAWLRQSFVDTAVEQLRTQATAARQMFGRDPAQIWLSHGTPIAGECMDQILDTFAAANVEFVSLEEAMADPMYATQPVVTERFRNMVQKWAQAKGVTIPNMPPAILAEVESIAEIEGESTEEVFGDILVRLCDDVGGDFSWPGWD